MAESKLDRIKDAKSAFQVLLQLSNLLNTGLDPETLCICIKLCEAGINPTMLASLIKELQEAVTTVNKTN